MSALAMPATQMNGHAAPPLPTAADPDAETNSLATTSVDLNKLRSYIVTQVKAAHPDQAPEAKQLAAMVERITQLNKLNLPDAAMRQLYNEVQSHFYGFGPLQVLLDDPDISEIMVNGPNQVFVECKGKLIKSDVTFTDDAEVIRVIQNIVAPLGRRIDADQPTVDARLPDGSRVNAVVPPVAIDGPSITIRKFARERLAIQNLINFDSINPEMAQFLEACVKAHLNVVVSGGTGSGKTTLLNILSSFIPDEERIVTIEDAAELQMQQEHVVRLETKAANLEGKGEVSIRDLVKNSLRMRPDRIVIGEVRGGEALDMLQAMNTGHDGSLTTVHSNSPRDAISRLETLVLMAGMDLPLRIVRQQIASAVDVIVQQTRLADGARKVTYITEVQGMEGEMVVLSDVFRFDQTGVDADGKVVGEHKPSGLRPLFMDRLQRAGLNLPANVFIPKG
jgi:pilus assembly protein CpaF